jgi:hypothetical protein
MIIPTVGFAACLPVGRGYKNMRVMNGTMMREKKFMTSDSLGLGWKGYRYNGYGGFHIYLIASDSSL